MAAVETLSSSEVHEITPIRRESSGSDRDIAEEEEEDEEEEAEQASSPPRQPDENVTYHVYTEPNSSFQNFHTLVEVSASLAEGEDSGAVHVQNVIDSQHFHSTGGASDADMQGHKTPSIERKKAQNVIKRRRPRHGDYDDGRTKICQVCGGMAGKHSYYGGQVCPSCRAFFRRSVTSGANRTYFCVKDGQCEVTCKTRKQCQYCRYLKCEEAGMKPSWVLSDAEKRPRSSEKSKYGVQSDLDDPVSELGGAGEPSGRTSIGDSGGSAFITDTELSLINELVEISDFWETSKVNDMDTALIREIIRMVAFGAKLTEGGLSQLAATLKLRARKVALRLREMQQLSEEDREEILSKNIPILIKLKISTFFNPELTWCKQLSSLLGSGEVEKLDKKLRSLEVEGLENLRLKYNQFFSSPFLETEESEQEFCKLLNKIGSWPEDEKEYILMSILLLFSPDLLTLQDRARVEQIQTSLAELLYNYLNHRHGRERGRSKFASAMFLVSRCRQLHDILTYHKIDLNC